MKAGSSLGQEFAFGNADSRDVISLKRENETLKMEIARLQSVLDESTEAAQNSAKSAKKYRKKCKVLATEATTNFDRVSQLTLEKDKLLTEISALEEDKNVLNLQLNAARATHMESESAWNVLRQNATQLTASLDSANEQLDNQRREITELSECRLKCLKVIERLHRSLCVSETMLGEVVAENKRLGKVKPKVVDEFKIYDLNNPFKGELGELVDKVLQSNQLKPQQQVQLILNEAAKAIEHQQQSQVVQSRNVSEIERFEKESEKSLDVLSALVGSLKQLAKNEEGISGKEFCEETSSITQFLALHSLDIDYFKDCLDERFTSFEILGSENQQNRVAVMEEISSVSGQAEAFVTALLLANAYLNKQVTTLLKAISKKRELDECTKVLGVEETSELPNKIVEVLSRLTRLEASKKNLKGIIQKLQKELTHKEERVKEATLDREHMETEINTLKSRVQVLSNKLILQSQPEAVPQPEVRTQETETSDTRILELENELAKKSSELEEIARMAQSQEEANANLNQTVNGLTAKLGAIQEAYQQLKMKELGSKDKNKKKLRSLCKQHEREMEEQRRHLTDTQKVMIQSNGDLHNKLQQVNTLSKNLSNALTESEKRNQALTDEIARLNGTCQLLETKIKTLEERNKKDKQSYEAQATAKILAAETRIHEENVRERSALITERRAIIGYIADELGTLYGLSGADLDQEMCRELLTRAKIDICKAKK